MPANFEEINSEEIIDAVKQGLRRVASLEPDNTPEWTRAVLSELCRIGRDQFRCQVYASGVDRNIRDGGEWLYDVTWLQRDGDGDLIDAPLVVECEWDNDRERVKDFEKLLLACAQVRVMIVDFGIIDDHPDANETDETEETNALRSKLAGKIRQFRRSGGGNAWLLAGVIQKEGNFFKRWYFNDLQ